MDADYLFISADGHQITHTAVAKVFQRVKEQAGVPKLHPHVCQHTFSVRYLVNGGDAFSLQKILGHTTLEMTRKYVNMAFGDWKAAHYSRPQSLGDDGLKWLRACDRDRSVTAGRSRYEAD